MMSATVPITMFAALDTATGLVISKLHRQLRVTEWRKSCKGADRHRRRGSVTGIWRRCQP